MDHNTVSSVPMPRPGDVLLVVDVQNDFLRGGALAVPDGNAVIPVLNAYIALFRSKGQPVCACRDWHPPRHSSFSEQGGPWPRHCVAGSHGAEFSKDLRLPRHTRVINKGTDETRPGYSAFESFHLQSLLTRLGCRRLVIGGLTADYCVLQTVLSARRRGFGAVVLEDAIRAVDARRGDAANALRRMRHAGAVFVKGLPSHVIVEDHAHGVRESLTDRPLSTRNVEKLPRGRDERHRGVRAVRAQTA